MRPAPTARARGRRRRPARLDRRQRQRHVGAADPLVDALTEKQSTAPARSPPPSARARPGSRPADCSPSSPRGSSASTRSSAPAAGCCSWRRTSSPPSGSSGVDPADFRLWVCLHEVTHQLQFTAVPWLSRTSSREIATFVEATDLSADVLRERLQDVVSSLADAVRGSEDNSEGLMALIKDPAQRDVLDRVTAVMSLVEGHAEYVMDGVGPDVVPTRDDAAQAVRPAAQGPGAARPRAAPAAGARAEDEAVRRGPDLRRRGGRPRRHGGLQPRLGGPATTCPCSRS